MKKTRVLGAIVLASAVAYAGFVLFSQKVINAQILGPAVSETQTSGATTNYTFWWNCTSAATNVADATRDCGDPSNPTIGLKEDGVTGDNYSTKTVYKTAGTYTAKVIVERSNLPATAKSISLTVCNGPCNGQTTPPGGNTGTGNTGHHNECVPLSSWPNAASTCQSEPNDYQTNTPRTNLPSSYVASSSAPWDPTCQEQYPGNQCGNYPHCFPEDACGTCSGQDFPLGQIRCLGTNQVVTTDQCTIAEDGTDSCSSGPPDTGGPTGGSPICTISASPSTLLVPPKASALISWSCNQAASCTLKANGSVITSSNGASGSQTVTPTSTTAYSITCDNGSPISATVTVRNINIIEGNPGNTP